MKLTISLTPEEHAALADYLVTPFATVDSGAERTAYTVLTKLVNQGAVIHGENLNHPSVKRVFSAEYARWRARGSEFLRRRKDGGPGSTQ